MRQLWRPFTSSIPFQAPRGVIDLIGVSLRDGNDQHPEATGRIETCVLARMARCKAWATDAPRHDCLKQTQ